MKCTAKYTHGRRRSMTLRASTVEELIAILQQCDPKARLIADGPDSGGYDVTSLPIVSVIPTEFVASLNHKLEGSFVSIGGEHVEPHDPDKSIYGKDWSGLVDTDPASVCLNPKWCKERGDCHR